MVDISVYCGKESFSSLNVPNVNVMQNVDIVLNFSVEMKLGITNLNEFLFSFLVAGICCVSAGAIPSDQDSGKIKNYSIHIHIYFV